MIETRIQLNQALAARVTAVVPAYNVSHWLGDVLREMPRLFSQIVVVDDQSTDNTLSIAESCAEIDSRIVVIRHERNQGVGGAMITGFRKALDGGADLIVKIDGDGQMPIWLVPELLAPLLSGEADYSKGNRFRDFKALRAMPVIRRIGNLILSFLSKAASGYWNCFDPTNGFLAIRGDVLSQLPLEQIDSSYFFEISMLSNLYILGAVVREVPMPALYQGEPSSLRIGRVLWQFPGRLLRCLVRRVTLKNFVYDFNVASLQMVCGSALLSAGILYGSYNWIWYGRHRLPAPTGTVLLPSLLVLLGVQFLLSVLNLDLLAVPTQPINSGPIPAAGADAGRSPQPVSSSIERR